MAQQCTFIITVAQAYTGQLPEVVSALETAGLHVSNVLKTLGQVVGEAADDLAGELERVQGVESVDTEQRYETR